MQVPTGPLHRGGIGRTAVRVRRDPTLRRLPASGKTARTRHSIYSTTLIRSGASDSVIQAQIEKIWSLRTDRFSDVRWQQVLAGGYQPRDHKKIEMITLGG